MKKPPLTIIFCLALTGFTALFWLGFGLSIVLGLHPSIVFDNLVSKVMVVLALLSGAVLAVLAIFLWRRSKLAYWVSVPLLALIAILSLTDELGFLDILSFIITAAALACLIAGRRWFFAKE